MQSCNVDIEVNLFDKKDLILRNLTDEDLEDEIERRIEEKIVVNDDVDLDVEFNVDISDFRDEILDSLRDKELIRELEFRDYFVYSEDEIPENAQCSKHGIAELVGLKWWATKEQILNELENIL